LLDARAKEILLPLSLSPSPLAPRRSPAKGLWPILLAGGAGVAALLALGFSGRAELVPAIVAATFTGGAILYAARYGRERRFELPEDGRAPIVADAGPPPYATLVDALPDPVVVVAADEPDDVIGRRLVYANPAARELLRIQGGDGRLVRVMRDPDVLEAVDEALFGAIESEAVYEPGGALARVFRARARPLGVARDGARLALLVFREETELRRVEQTRADFLANASHELRTPLASLSGFIETLRGHAREDEGARDRFLGIMQTQAERMSRLIDDLMSLSRIELNEHLHPENRVDLALAARDVLDALAPLALERGVRLEPLSAPTGEAVVAGDRDQILQVLQNLADNALKYSPKGGSVRIAIETELSAAAAAAYGGGQGARLSLLSPDHGAQLYVAVRVADEGSGIAREHLPRLTERFYRVEGQKSDERSGTGLGLAIVKHIMNRHRGGLVVESGLSQGTSFTAYFPQFIGSRDIDRGLPKPSVATKLS
jgi:two-component system phosphate regulon sensor histidine kinase PhoR